MKTTPRKSKKPVRQAQGKKPAAKKKITVKKPVVLGVVTHFYTNIKVAIVKFKTAVKVGTEVQFRGSTTDFKQKIASMQFDHEAIMTAKKGKEVGMKVSKRVREGDEVLKA